MLVDGARGSRRPASPRHALLAESPNLEAWGKPSLGVIILEFMPYPEKIFYNNDLYLAVRAVR